MMKWFKMAFAAVIAGAALLMSPFVAPAMALDPIIERAMDQGVVGERIDGYLGIISGADAAVSRKVDEINAGRRAAYANMASREGVNLTDVARLTGERLVAAQPSGHYVYDDTGRWVIVP